MKIASNIAPFGVSALPDIGLAQNAKLFRDLDGDYHVAYLVTDQ